MTRLLSATGACCPLPVAVHGDVAQGRSIAERARLARRLGPNSRRLLSCRIGPDRLLGSRHIDWPRPPPVLTRFSHTGNLARSFNPRIYRMLFDVFRFNLFGLDLVAGDQDPQRVAHTSQEKTDDVDEFGEGELSIGEYLERERFGKGFIEDYLLVRLPGGAKILSLADVLLLQPMTAAM